MLAPESRLTRTEIEEIVKGGRRIEGENLGIRYLGAKDGVRLAIVVSKKVAKLAAKRNLLKRRTRHIIRKHQNVLPRRINAVIFLKPPAAKLTFTELEAETLKIFNKIGK